MIPASAALQQAVLQQEMRRQHQVWLNPLSARMHVHVHLWIQICGFKPGTRHTQRVPALLHAYEYQQQRHGALWCQREVACRSAALLPEDNAVQD